MLMLSASVEFDTGISFSLHGDNRVHYHTNKNGAHDTRMGKADAEWPDLADGSTSFTAKNRHSM